MKLRVYIYRSTVNPNNRFPYTRWSNINSGTPFLNVYVHCTYSLQKKNSAYKQYKVVTKEIEVV